MNVELTASTGQEGRTPAEAPAAGVEALAVAVAKLLKDSYRADVEEQAARMGNRPGLLSVSEAAALLGTSARTVRRWCKEGAIPFVRLPATERAEVRTGTTAFELKSLEAWIASRRVPAVSGAPRRRVRREVVEVGGQK